MKLFNRTILYDPPAPYWICSLLGCDIESNQYCVDCQRCGSNLYGDIDFVHTGLLWDFICFLRYRVLTGVMPRFCGVCGKFLGFGSRGTSVCDKQECLDRWIPF